METRVTPMEFFLSQNLDLRLSSTTVWRSKVVHDESFQFSAIVFARAGDPIGRRPPSPRPVPIKSAFTTLPGGQNSLAGL